ncbi:hypothetical protein [Aeromonas veronii]|uniref:hypothetical protein n=1 Tax=Aeromonas veronii TaxID=654 RepID=UPI003F7427A6
MKLVDFLHSKSFFDCSRIHLAPNIPPQKINNAANTFNLKFPAHEVAVLIDDTMLGSGKDGVLICKTGIVVREAFSDPTFYPFTALTSIRVEGTKLYLNQKKVISFSMPEKKEIQRLFLLASEWHQEESNENSDSITPPVIPVHNEKDEEKQNQLTLAQQDEVKNNISSYIFTAIENNKNQIIPLLKLKGGELSQTLLEDDQNVERIASFIYACLPGFVHFVVKEQQVINFLLKHRNKLVESLFIPPSHTPPALSFNDEFDALFKDDDQLQPDGLSSHAALKMAIQELRSEFQSDPDSAMYLGHSLQMALAVLDALEKSKNINNDTSGEDVVFALVIMHAFSYHKLPDFMINSDEENTFATIYIIGLMMLLDSYSKHHHKNINIDEAMVLCSALMKCPSKEKLNQLIRNIIESGDAFNSTSIFTAEDILLLLRKANQYSVAWSEKLVKSWLQDELAIQRKWGDLFVK